MDRMAMEESRSQESEENIISENSYAEADLSASDFQ
jgi:hypothetical protein